MDIQKLKEKRETLKSQLAELDARIAKAERGEKEREARELVKLIQSRGLSADKIRQLLDGGV